MPLVIVIGTCITGMKLSARDIDVILRHLIEPILKRIISCAVLIKMRMRWQCYIRHEVRDPSKACRALLASIIEWAKSSPDVEKIELHVRSSNENAQALYQKLGFTEEGRWKHRVKVTEGKYLDDILAGLWLKELPE